MRKLTMTSTAVVLVLGAMTLQASAQSQHCGAASIPALKNATPIVKKAACNGTTGYCGCGPGWISACAPRLPVRSLLLSGVQACRCQAGVQAPLPPLCVGVLQNARFEPVERTRRGYVAALRREIASGKPRRPG
jgi:hypothetical protein